MWPPSCGADGLYLCSTHLGELKPQWRPESFLTGVIYVRTKALLPGFLTGAVRRTAVVAGRRESKVLPQSQSPTFKPFPPRKQGPQTQSHDPSCSGTTVGRELEKKVRIPEIPEGGARGCARAQPAVSTEADISPWLCCVSFSPSSTLQPLDKAPILPAVSQLWGTSLTR